MFSPFLILLLVALVALLTIGYRRPEALDAPSFSFTRSCLGITIFTYAASLVSLQSADLARDAPGLAIIAQILAWIFLIFTLRGVFEVLAGK